MTDSWQLPTPRRFVRGIAEDLRAGNNVVVTFPSHTNEGWFAALRREIRDLNLQRLETIEADGAVPLTSLANHLGLNPRRTGLRLTELCDAHEFQGRLLYIRADCAVGWPAWRDFLAEYEEACRRFDLARRTLFVASLHHELSIAAPATGNLLRCHQWDGCMDSLNIRLYAATLLSGESIPAWQRQLATEVLAELSLWDPSVCEAGAGLGLRTLLDPVKWLADLGTGRGWAATDDANGTSARWRGIRLEIEGRSRLHSGWLAVAGRSDPIAHRVWNGQVAALFPLLERQRRALLRSHCGLLRVPWATPFGRIDRIEDLELNHIADQFAAQRSSGLRNTFEFVCWLRDMRNDLAHLEPVSAARVLDARFQDRLLRALASEEE